MLKRIPVLVLVAMLTITSASAQQTWTPGFELVPSTCSVVTGGTFSVDVFLSGVAGSTSGYQVEVLFDPALVSPMAIVQGSYLPFSLFLGNPTAFTDKVRIGALNFPNPQPIAAGSGMGIVATVVFQAVAAGPVHLDMTDFTVMSPPGGSFTINATTQDAVIQVRNPTDQLSVCGAPNLGQTLTLEFLAPGNGGSLAVTAGALSDSGITIPGVGVVPLAFDPLLDLALQNAFPFSGSVGMLDATGSMTTTFTIPNVPLLIGTRFWFGSVATGAGGIVISNGTYVDVIGA